jgi:hypothetical protein
MPVGRSDGCTYRVVLIQPHDRRTGVVLNLHYVINRYTRSLRAPRLRAWACARIRMFKVT